MWTIFFIVSEALTNLCSIGAISLYSSTFTPDFFGIHGITVFPLPLGCILVSTTGCSSCSSSKEKQIYILIMCSQTLLWNNTDKRNGILLRLNHHIHTYVGFRTFWTTLLITLETLHTYWSPNFCDYYFPSTHITNQSIHYPLCQVVGIGHASSVHSFEFTYMIMHVFEKGQISEH